MNPRTRRLSTLATVVMATTVALATPACKKDKSGGGATGAAGDMLGYLPKDTAGVVAINPGKLMGGELFKKYEDKFMAGMPKEISELKEKCGIDLLSDISTVMVASGASWESESDVVVAIKGKWDQKKVEECISTMGGSVEGGVYTMDNEPLNTHWAAADTIVVSEGVSVDKLKISAGNSAKDNSELMKGISKVDSSAGLWAAGSVPAALKAPLGDLKAPPKAFFVSLSADSGIKAKLGMRFEKADDAKSASTLLSQALDVGKAHPMAGPFLEKVSTSHEGTTLTIDAELSMEQIGKAESMLGAMGGFPF